jgi:hypothetical protein
MTNTTKKENVLGYTMDLVEAEFRIPKEHLPRALQALKGLLPLPDSHGPISGWKVPLAETNTLPQALDLWGWEVVLDEEGNVVDLHIPGGGKKYLNDDRLFETLAPYVEQGSFLVLEGEDRERWRWRFDGETLITEEGKVVYD